MLLKPFFRHLWIVCADAIAMPLQKMCNVHKNCSIIIFAHKFSAKSLQIASNASKNETRLPSENVKFVPKNAISAT